MAYFSATGTTETVAKDIAKNVNATWTKKSLKQVMPISLLPALLFAILVVGYSPGPANLYALACVLKYGRKQALKMWRGELVGFCIAVSILALLTHFVGEVMGEYVSWLKYLGAAYILWLAWKMLNRDGVSDNDATECSFTSGMIVQLTNAKMMLFDLTAFSVYVLPYSNKLADLFVVSAILTIAGPGGNIVWLLAGAYLRRFFVSYMKPINRVMALLLAACSIYIIL